MDCDCYLMATKPNKPREISLSCKLVLNNAKSVKTSGNITMIFKGSDRHCYLKKKLHDKHAFYETNS